ncbi:MAG: hypothetical protein ACLFPL_04050 [Candidatus Nanoarchaeia archaeon]
MVEIFDIENFKHKIHFEYNIQETQKLRELFENKKKEITINDLRRISLWKLDRVLEIDENTLEKINVIFNKEDLKFNDKIVIELIEELKNSKGVGFPMLSSFLKFIRPDLFPIIDIRAYRALYGKKIYSSQYSIEKYFNYIEKVYEIRDSLNLKLYEVDEKLYCFDRDNNGKI